jgi:hypothetical protein
MNAPLKATTEFEDKYWGTLYSVLSWEQLTALWQKLDSGAGWYLYAVGQDVPSAKSSSDEVDHFVKRIDELLRKEHEEDYCGIVYADDLAKPSFIKIYDPHNLGVSCGSSGHHIFPGWIMSQQTPVNLDPAVVPNNRKKWWQSLFGG